MLACPSATVCLARVGSGCSSLGFVVQSSPLTGSGSASGPRRKRPDGRPALRGVARSRRRAVEPGGVPRGGSSPTRARRSSSGPRPPA